MKSSTLVVLCMFSLLTLHAESPILEETSLSPITYEQYEQVLDEKEFLEQELSLLDEESQDFEEELGVLDISTNPSDNTADIISFEKKDTQLLSPVIDISLPLENIEKHIPLPIVEEKASPLTPHSLETQQALAPASAFVSDPELVVDQAEKKSYFEAEPPAELNIESSSSDLKHNLDVKLDLKRAFAGSPLIYTLLLAMSIFSLFIWLFSILSLKKTSNVSQQVMGSLHSNLNGNHFDQALTLCNGQDALLCKMVASGIQSRKYGLSAMIESMKAEGKRSSMNYWQKIGLLNDIAVVAPMLGLLGTVLGMFYAFYDLNRSIESISSLFDGLGVSVGTTVAGLVVAILALILHSTAKYRLIKVLSQVESEAHGIASLIDNHTSLYGQSK